MSQEAKSSSDVTVAPEVRQLANNERVTLRSGARMPLFGLGTYLGPSGDLFKAIVTAIELGYRHIDCAYIYGNESEIGDALEDVLKRGVVKREDLWITSKLWPTRYAPEQVAAACEHTLKALKLEYLDLYLLHWPISVKLPDDCKEFGNTAEEVKSSEFAGIPLSETWKALEGLVATGKVRDVGVSNMSVQLLADLMTYAKIKPSVNQVEAHPYLSQTDLLKFCRANGVHMTAYAPLGRPGRTKGNPTPFQDDVVEALAKKHGVGVTQVLIKWSLQRGVSAVPKTTNPGRLADNMSSLALPLSDDDMKQLDALGQKYSVRLVSTFNGYNLFA